MVLAVSTRIPLRSYEARTVVALKMPRGLRLELYRERGRKYPHGMA